MSSSHGSESSGSPLKLLRGIAEYFFDKVEELHETGVHHLFLVPFTFASILVLSFYTYPAFFAPSLQWILILFPVWGPLFLYKIWWKYWLIYVRSLHGSHIRRVTVELKVPATVEKTPSAMEYVFAGVHVHAPGAVFYANWWHGISHPHWSFEMHSFEGHVRFFINCEEPIIDLLKEQLYAQYPGIEVVDVEPDYLSGLHFNKKTMEGYAIEMVKKANGLPIKTYVDFEMDDVFVDVEERTDPLCEMFEMLSGLGPGEQAFVQIIIEKDVHDHWRHIVTHKIQEIYDKSAVGYVDVQSGKETKGSSQLTPVDIKRIKALERSLEKNIFETGVRVFYLTRKKDHQHKVRSTRFVHIFRQFHSDVLNSLKTGREYWHQPLDFPWQDYKNIRRDWFSARVIDALRRREIFRAPYEHMVTFMNTEELASIYHLPSNECKAPGIERMQSKRSNAPDNLPV